jgi:uroporphyrinogen-III decarboxylase
VDDIAATDAHGFMREPLTDRRPLVERYGQTHVIIGNADTRVLLMGSREEIRAEVAGCIELGRACSGFFLSVSNHIPPNTPSGKRVVLL